MNMLQQSEFPTERSSVAPAEQELESATPTKPAWEMKELKPMHKQLCSMLAQGIDRETIAAVLEITPTYVSMLSKQPLVQSYIREMCQFANLQLEAQFVKSVEVIGEILDKGANKDRLQAARLNAELSHRIGNGSGLPPEATDTAERLTRLAERLLALQEKMQPNLPTIDGEYCDLKAENRTETDTGEQRCHQAALPFSDGAADSSGYSTEGGSR